MANPWIQRNRIWLFPSIMVLIVGTGWFFISGMNKVVADLGFAYSETELYDRAIVQLNANQEVVAVFGAIQELDKLAIFEGETRFSIQRDSVKSSVRIEGDKSKGRCDIHAHKNNGVWEFDFLQARIKSPAEKAVTIVLIE